MHPQITTPLRLQDLDNKSSSLQRTTLPLSSRHETANLVPYNSIHFSFIADNRGSKLTPKYIPESVQLWVRAPSLIGILVFETPCQQWGKKLELVFTIF
jgi:hypothetical protein